MRTGLRPKSPANRQINREIFKTSVPTVDFRAPVREYFSGFQRIPCTTEQGISNARTANFLR